MKKDEVKEALSSIINYRVRLKMYRYNLFWMLEHFLLKTPLATRIRILRKHTYEVLITYLQTYNGRSSFEVPELNLDDKLKIKSYIKKGIPFRIKNGLLHLKAYQKWDLDYLDNVCGELHQPVYRRKGDVVEAENITISEIIKNIRAGSNLENVLFGNLILKSKRLEEDLRSFFYKRFLNYRLSIMKTDHFFLNQRGNYTEFHSELSNNFFMQVSGSKEWRIFVPKVAPFFLPLVQKKMFLMTSINFDDEKDFPALKLPHYSVTMSEGDLLYVPPLCWHSVKTLTNSIGVACRWTNLSVVLKHPFFVTLLVTISNPNILQKIFDKKLTNPEALN